MDPDVMASQFQIELRDIRGKRCLVFMDNGHGMVPEQLHKMLGFGHSEKEDCGQHRAIGRYGNGFKSGSMRLGSDALVLTKHASGSQSVGFLSRTFLHDIGAEEVLVPMISWDHAGQLLDTEQEAMEESLQAIAEYSIFRTEEELLMQFAAIPKTGSVIIITGLKQSGGDYELDFDGDEGDIQLFPTSGEEEDNARTVPYQHYRYQYSLQAYLSVLYKVPRMQIFLRGKKIKTKRVASSLCERMVERYRPRNQPGSNSESYLIEMGFNSEGSEECGMMLYHNNRLIAPYQRVGLQLEAGNSKGAGVVGVVECDFLHPTHNKQDFNDTKFYRSLIFKLSAMLKHFWWARVESVPDPLPSRRKRLRASREAAATTAGDEVVELLPDDVWVQCDYPDCLKWRKMPEGTDPSSLPSSWYCYMHPNPAIAKASHAYPEEPYEEEEDRTQRIRETQASKKAFKNSQSSKKTKLVTTVQADKLRVLEELEEQTRAHEVHLASEQEGLQRLQQQLRSQYANMQPNLAGALPLVAAPVVTATGGAVGQRTEKQASPVRQNPVSKAGSGLGRVSPPDGPVTPAVPAPVHPAPSVGGSELEIPGDNFDWKGGCIKVAKKLHLLLAALGAGVPRDSPCRLEDLVELDMQVALRRATGAP